MPQTFTDNKGTKWTIDLHLGLCREIRTGPLGIDIFNPQQWAALIGSLEIRLSFIWFAVQKQAVEMEIEPRQFEERLYGDKVADEASNTLLVELADFFRRLGQPGTAVATDKNRQIMETAQRRTRDPVFLKTVEEELEALGTRLLGTMDEPAET